MRRHETLVRGALGAALAVGFVPAAAAQHGEHAGQPQDQAGAQELPSTARRPDHLESAASEQAEQQPVDRPGFPSLPEGMTLDEVLARAGKPPPEDFPEVVMDDELRVFTLVDQLEQRFVEEQSDLLVLEAEGYVGLPRDRFWWKAEGEAVEDGSDRGELDLDLLYSRLVRPFWHAQAGVQYAAEWDRGHEDRWSLVAGLEGLAPGTFEIDSALYLSEDGDLTAEGEAEFDLRVTQRLVLQPRADLGLALQDVDDRALGAGFTDLALGLRLRYELRRELAPYVGLRYATLLGETRDLADAAGEEDEELALLVGVRLAW